jgi:hypothetical protein
MFPTYPSNNMMPKTTYVYDKVNEENVPLVEFDFNQHQLYTSRTPNDSIYPSFTYFNMSYEPRLLINVLCNVRSLEFLPVLIPKVQILQLNFCEKYSYDLNALLALKELKLLIITGNSNLFKLKNLASLKELELKSLIVFGHILDPKDPKMIWPKLRNPIYAHIEKIINNGSITSYYMIYRKCNDYLEHFIGEFSSSDVVIQKCQNSYQIIYYEQSTNNDSGLYIKPLNEKEFNLLIMNRNEDDKYKDLQVIIPQIKDDLWIQDTEN